jgi:dyslexia susceptibility 1 candidate gene 1 protein
MPVTPNFEWEQTNEHVIVRGEFKGFKPEAIDIFISDLFAKVNAHPTYLLSLDLLHPIIVETSTFRIVAPVVTLTLTKFTTGLVWDTLCVDKKTPFPEIKARRQESLERAEKLYNTKLDTREKQKEVEKKRMFNEHWELEKQQRRDIEQKVRAERNQEAASLAAWEERVGEESSSAHNSSAPPLLSKEENNKPKPSSSSILSPSDIYQLHLNAAPPIRQAETVTVGIDFTPKSMSMPSRSRGDEDFYRKSRYKPVSVEDSPMYWKEKGDKYYKSRNWKQSCDAYSESIKRDGCFLTCVSNRAACWLHMCEWKRAIEDCDLALTLLANTPASETTQERYRYLLMKLHTRRGSAYAWSGEYGRALEELRLANAYQAAEGPNSAANDIGLDLHLLETYMKEQGLVEARDPLSTAMHEASRLYYNGNYAGAVEGYKAILQENEFEVKARNNLSAALLHMGCFREAYEESSRVISFCAEVAQALHQPGATSATLADSDDEEEGDAEDEMVARRNAAAKKITEKSGHVYLLLKAYVRAAGALCGLKDYRKAYELMEMAIRITPYDDDLRDDANRIAEKLRFDTLVSASTRSAAAAVPAPPPPAQAVAA